MSVEYQDKFIAFVDILGFSDLVTQSESGGLPLNEILALTRHLGTGRERSELRQFGPTWCPASKRLSTDLDFQVSQVSDCVIVSAEISPAGALNLIGHCWRASMRLLQDGFMCRGYVTRGAIYHTETQFVGTGYLNALSGERDAKAFRLEADERGTPFVEVDPTVCEFIASQGDECVKKMFSRMVKVEDGDAAIFPFQRLMHQFAITQDFDPAKEKASNDVVRKMLQDLKDKVLALAKPENEKATRKARHYVRALDQQLAVCDKTDHAIDVLMQPFPRPRREV